MGNVKQNIKSTFEKHRKITMEDKTLDKNIQAAVNKLVSDEWFAGQIYK